MKRKIRSLVKREAPRFLSGKQEEGRINVTDSGGPKETIFIEYQQ